MPRPRAEVLGGHHPRSAGPHRDQHIHASLVLHQRTTGARPVQTRPQAQRSRVGRFFGIDNGRIDPSNAQDANKQQKLDGQHREAELNPAVAGQLDLALFYRREVKWKLDHEPTEERDSGHASGPQDANEQPDSGTPSATASNVRYRDKLGSEADDQT